MVVSLAEAKLFLRVDGDTEDALITSLIATSEELCESVIREEMTSFRVVPETLKQAILFCVATLYEQRQGGKDGLDTAQMLDVVRRMTFAYRKESW